MNANQLQKNLFLRNSVNKWKAKKTVPDRRDSCEPEIDGGTVWDDASNGEVDVMVVVVVAVVVVGDDWRSEFNVVITWRDVIGEIDDSSKDDAKEKVAGSDDTEVVVVGDSAYVGTNKMRATDAHTVIESSLNLHKIKSRRIMNNIAKFHLKIQFN